MSLHAPLQLVPCHVGTELLDPAGEVHRASAALSNAHAAASPCPAEDGHVAVGRAVDVQVVPGPVGPLRGVGGVSGLVGSVWGVFPRCCAGQAGWWRGGSNLVEAAGLGRALPPPLVLADTVEGGGLVQPAAVRRDALDALGRLSSGAGTLWSTRESRGLPPPGTQETIDTALESSRRGERSFVETKCSFEAVRARDADQISDLSAQPPRWLMIGPSDLFDVAQRADAAAEALRRTPHRARTAAASARHA